MAKKRNIKIKRGSKKHLSPEALVEDFRAFFIATGLLLTALIVGFALWLVHSGWLEKKVDAFTNGLIAISGKAGFEIENVLVEGRNETQKDQILNVLGVHKGAPILGYDVRAALGRLETLSWVKGGVVERRLPQTIFVKLSEREPIAIWQMNKQFHLIDRDGHILRDLGSDEPFTLPLVVGEGANTHAAEMLGQLLQQKNVMDHVKALVRVSDRRWNLYLDDKVTVQLPEDNTGKALEQLGRAIAQENILERKITGIDLRLPDRMTISTDDVIDPDAGKKKKK